MLRHPIAAAAGLKRAAEVLGRDRPLKDQRELRSEYLFARPVSARKAALEVRYFIVQLRLEIAIEVPVDTDTGSVSGARGSGGIGKRIGTPVKGGTIEMYGMVSGNELPRAEPAVPHIMTRCGFVVGFLLARNKE